MTIDTTLLLNAARGDGDAFAELMRLTRPLVRMIVGQRVGRAVAEDLVQETYLRAWKDLPRLRDPRTFTSWLARIAHARVRDWARRREVEQAALPQLAVDVEATYEVDFTGGELSGRVRRALETLEPDARTLLLLRHCKDHTPQEIATALDMNPVNVRKSLSRARAKLRSLLEDPNDA